MKWPIVTLQLMQEDDIVVVRQRARSIAEHLGFSLQDQLRIATAVSEIARNAFSYAGGGKVEYGIADGPFGQGHALVVRVTDTGPGIADYDTIVDGQYRSPNGLGLGIVGARRLMDDFDLQSAPGRGTKVTMSKTLHPSIQMTGPKVVALSEAVKRSQSDDPNAAMREQNRELLRSLSELSERQEETQRLNRELDETNRGVVALHAELEAQASQLREAGTTLESQVATRTAELARANERLRGEAAERERMEGELRQSQKMEAVGQLTGGHGA